MTGEVSRYLHIKKQAGKSARGREGTCSKPAYMSRHEQRRIGDLQARLVRQVSCENVNFRGARANAQATVLRVLSLDVELCGRLHGRPHGRLQPYGDFHSPELVSKPTEGKSASWRPQPPQKILNGGAIEPFRKLPSFHAWNCSLLGSFEPVTSSRTSRTTIRCSTQHRVPFPVSSLPGGDEARSCDKRPTNISWLDGRNQSISQASDSKCNRSPGSPSIAATRFVMPLGVCRHVLAVKIFPAPVNRSDWSASH